MLLDIYCLMFILFLIFVGINLIGMYFNLVMVIGYMFGCKGIMVWEYVVVYWIGFFIGCFLVMLMDWMLYIDVVVMVVLEIKKKK